VPAGLSRHEAWDEGWPAEVLDRLHRRLNAPDPSPVAVALSGGGDSLALLHLARLWSERAGRPLVALTVDHGLQAQGAEWGRFAAERARRLGARHRTLIWTGKKPTSGLPAAARAARHALLAEAARGLGARVILMGHTFDDVWEAAEMRREGATVPTPEEWAPSPAWPEGRGVFLLRPLLSVRRKDLRALLAELGETWIEDPANEDARFSRARARRRLALEPPPPPGAPLQARQRPLAEIGPVSEGDGGELIVSRRDVSLRPDAPRRLSAVVLCAAGGVRPPRGASVHRLLERLAGADPFSASLAGARIQAGAGEVVVCREAGEQDRGAMAAAPLPEGESVFDGRFLVAAPTSGYRIAALRGQAGRLARAERERLARIPAGARGALPVVISPAETLSCPILAQDGPVCVRPLGLERLRAALGEVADEAALWRVAKSRKGA
jgi:tRNA(Ile)-lysidine synthase